MTYVLISNMLIVGIGLAFLTLALYIYRNDQILQTIPPRVTELIGDRATSQSIEELGRRRGVISVAEDTDLEDLPPKTGRRYIVVGGGGFVGGWNVAKLLARGEAPANIRILDFRPPTNPRAIAAVESGVQFIAVDITDAVALEAAFTAPWPSASGAEAPELTVFHHVAEIRFFERLAQFLPKSERVNVQGTKNVIAASRVAGATVLIYTSSGSIGIHRTASFLWPWQSEPEKFVQIINDDESQLPKRDDEFFSNYGVVKAHADRLVRAADKTVLDSLTETGAKKVMRTGVVRPGQAIFGPNDEVVCVYLSRGSQPTWWRNSAQSFLYVENCVAAHLCYEARLVELLNGGTSPDIGGQAFLVTDPGPVPTYGDMFTLLETMTNGRVNFFSLSSTAMLLFGHGLEIYYSFYHRLLDGGWKLACFIPELKGDVVKLQPAFWHLLAIHVIYDDSRARLAPEKGGLGYTGKWTSLEAMHKTVESVLKNSTE